MVNHPKPPPMIECPDCHAIRQSKRSVSRFTPRRASDGVYLKLCQGCGVARYRQFHSDQAAHAKKLQSIKNTPGWYRRVIHSYLFPKNLSKDRS